MAVVVLTPGANVGIPECSRILVAVGWEPKSVAGMEIDASVFMVKADGKVPDDGYFVFYGAQSSPDGSVRFLPSPPTGFASDVQAFEVEPGKVSADVESIDVCVTLHEGQVRGQSFGSLTGVFARLVDPSSGHEVARFDLPVAGMKETAITLAKVYRRNGQWKIRAVGQGFVGGLAPLARQYGVDVADDASTPPPVQEKPAPPPPPPAPKPVSLTKVTLEKRGQSVSLEKKAGEGFGEIVFNLNWNQRPEKKGGFLGRILGGNKGIDLDLGCLWELEDGDKGVIQALGEAWGEYRSEPFIRHAGDDRTGAIAQGENIRINGDKLSKIKRILVFAFIYEGVPNWAAADGVATVKVPGQHDIEVRLDNPASGQGMCAIALIENDKGKLKVTKEEQYFRGHLDMDKAYRWGLRWVAGSKN
ncbi:TerD family protein [Magnetospirillum molischianum]|uniref:Tellurium resistance protein terA n=1 Tax=Magnetospirillum molischianum DSM 120 TaxID=1150626 RepID=H8FWG2_MAGML|nr:TerD family protein [Magnetospirillum molischianum]CCG42700.1 Tellurium resistance protein terA [Magnetospirillum molischianum DSM 120]